MGQGYTNGDGYSRVRLKSDTNFLAFHKYV